MTRILIVGSAKLPCPATKGGAVPILTEHLLREYEVRQPKDVELYCCSIYEKDACDLASTRYPLTRFLWVRDSWVSIFCDALIRFFLSIVRAEKRINSYSYFFRTMGRRRKVKRILSQKSFDRVVFENSLLLLGVMKNKKLASKYSQKFYFHSHAIPKGFYGTAEVLKNAAGIISVSSFLAHYYSFAFPPSGSAKNLIVPNCVDTSLFYPRRVDGGIRKRFGIPETSFLVLFVGRLVEDKGILDLVKAINYLDDPHIALLVCGSTFYKKGKKTQFQKALENEASSSRSLIVFSGYVNNESLPDYYSSCDVFVSPSHCHEAAGLMNVEALSCGARIITTNDGGIPEYVAGTGSIIVELEAGDAFVLSLARAIKEVVNSNDKKNEKDSETIRMRNSASGYYERMMEALDLC